MPQWHTIELWLHLGGLQSTQKARWGGGGCGTPIFGLYGDVPLDREWFFGLAVLNRVYNLTCLCPKQVKNPS